MTNKNTNKIFSIAALAAGMLLASCSDMEPTTPQDEAADPNAINFSIGQGEASSRTQYSADDDLQIEWLKGDNITIWATPAKGSATSADYVVSQVVASTKTIDGKEVTTNSKAKIAPTGTGLKWSGDVQHTFCGIYGEKVLSFSLSDGQAAASLQYPMTQTLVDVNGAWANMQQAYMVAYKQTMPAENVNLSFKPIMTTLDVVVSGMAEGAADAKAIKVKSMSVKIGSDADVLYSVGEDMYFDIEFNNNGLISATPSTTKSKMEITFAFDPTNLPKVEIGKSITITAILPSIEISTAKPVTITVTTDDDTSKSFKFSGPVTAGNKAKIETKPWGTQQSTVPEGAVDMGLSVYWAESALPNASSSRAYDYSYYGWGCTKSYPETYYGEWVTYFNTLGAILDPAYYDYACGTQYDPLVNYANNPDQYPLAGSDYDIAYVSNKGKWRMPTKSDWEELRDTDNCEWEWQDNYNGEKGYKVTSKKTGKSIFLPAAGSHQEQYGILNIGSYGFYWSSTPNATSRTDSAWYLEFNNPSDPNIQVAPSLKTSLRCKAYAIYPVAAK